MVDYYGRTYNEKLTKEDGTSRLIWIAPEGGTSIGVDPAAVFKGANEPELAQAFVDFLLTEQGQVLWNKKPGTTNGPKYNRCLHPRESQGLHRRRPKSIRPQ